jgi:hypothetical protein
MTSSHKLKFPGGSPIQVPPKHNVAKCLCSKARREPYCTYLYYKMDRVLLFCIHVIVLTYTLSNQEQIFYWHKNAYLRDIQQKCMYTSLLFHLLFMIDVIFLIVQAPNAITYVEKCAELNKKLRIIFILYLYVKDIDWWWLEILKTHLKMMNGCKIYVTNFEIINSVELKFRNETCGIGVFSSWSLVNILLVNLIEEQIQILHQLYKWSFDYYNLNCRLVQ